MSETKSSYDINGCIFKYNKQQLFHYFDGQRIRRKRCSLYRSTIGRNHFAVRYDHQRRVWVGYVRSGSGYYSSLDTDCRFHSSPEKLNVFQHIVDNYHFDVTPEQSTDNFTGMRNNDWYYNGELAFEHYSGNVKRWVGPGYTNAPSFIGKIKGYTVRVKYYREYKNKRWWGTINGRFIDGSGHSKCELTCKWLYEEWDGKI